MYIMETRITTTYLFHIGYGILVFVMSLYKWETTRFIGLALNKYLLTKVVTHYEIADYQISRALFTELKFLLTLPTQFRKLLNISKSNLSVVKLVISINYQNYRF